MERNDIAWIFVRAIGVYFCAQALFSLYHIIALSFSLTTLYEFSNSSDDTDHLLLRTWFNIGIATTELLLYSFISYYCLRKGAFIHKLLMYKSGNEKPGIKGDGGIKKWSALISG